MKSKFGWVLPVLVLMSIVSSACIFIKGRTDAPFVDEVTLNLPAVQNLIHHGNFTTSDWGDFTPMVSSGIWTIFPSGFVSSFKGVSLTEVRLVSYCFSLFLIGIATFFGLGLFKNLSRSHRVAFTIIFVGMFISFIPYRIGSYLTLGEIPAGGYFGLGLSLLTSHPGLGFFFLGVTCFGGKMVYVAFIVPLVFVYLFLSSKERFSKRATNVAFIFIPLILWFALMFVCIGPHRSYLWFTELLPRMFHQNGHFAAGAGADLPGKYSLIERLKDHNLEWAQMGYPQEARVAFLLLMPIFVLGYFSYEGLKQNGLNWIRNNPIIIGLMSGQVVFAIWFFFLHPFMWIRSVQPAFIVAIGLMGWGFMKLYQQKPQWKLTLDTAAATAASLLFICRIIEVL